MPVVECSTACSWNGTTAGWRGFGVAKHVLSLSSPAMARAKSRAANGSRSSTPSPTPMKCTGRPNFAASATRMPPRAVPSSLVMTRPVTPAIFWNISTWLSAFWPTVASSTSRVACGALGVDFLQHAHDLFELGHQPGLVLQPPGRVDEEHIGAAGLCFLQRVVGQAGRIRALLAGDHRRADALAPDLQLLDGGGAERVAGGEHHAQALLAEFLRQLADGGGLARAVHADHQDHVGLRRAVDRRGAWRRAGAPSRPRRPGSPCTSSAAISLS